MTLGKAVSSTTWIFICFLLGQQSQIQQCVKGAVIYADSKQGSSASSDYPPDDIVEVNFLTSRWRRDVEFTMDDYHIIEIRGARFQNQSLEMHVTSRSVTTSDFKIVTKEGDVIVQEEVNVTVSCLYAGVLKSDPNSKVAISLCGEEDQVSGLIMTDDGDWMIEPLPVSPKSPTIKNNHHRLRRATEADDLSTVDLSTDQLHVPKDKLKEAVEQAAEDAKAAQEEAMNGLMKTGDLDVMNQSKPEIIPLVQEIQAEEQYVVALETLAKKPAAGSGTSSKKPTTKSSTSGKKSVVEIAVFTDPEFYEEMKVRYPKDTDTKIRDYILTVINAVDIIYEHKSLGTDMVFKLCHLEVMKKLPSKLKKNGKSAKEYLTSFCQYAGSLNKNNALWDHGLLLTGSDLQEGASTLTAGLAWAGTMCYRYYSCSVSEALQLGAVYVIAHELGHSLGMDHDGSGTCKSCDAHKFLMSPTTGTGKVTWSNCSSKNLVDFMKSGSPELRGSDEATPPVCLSTTSRESTEVTYKDGKLPGKKFDAVKQCHLSLGKKFSPYMTKSHPFNAICGMLYCSNTTHATTTHAALEGTDCATGKICRGGECVAN